MKLNAFLFASTVILSVALFYSIHGQADSQPIIINNNANNTPPAATNPPANASGCNTPPADNSNTLRPGTYYKADPQGGMDTVYTTGDKSMYNADVNCNNNSVAVQPYVYAPVAPPAPMPLRTK